MSATMTAAVGNGCRDSTMEGWLARWYARNTGKNLKDFRKAAAAVAAQVAAGSAVLEVAPGPGYLAVELAKLGDYRVAGLDISQEVINNLNANYKAAPRPAVGAAPATGPAAATPGGTR